MASLQLGIWTGIDNIFNKKNKRLFVRWPSNANFIILTQHAVEGTKNNYSIEKGTQDNENENEKNYNKSTQNISKQKRVRRTSVIWSVLVVETSIPIENSVRVQVVIKWDRTYGNNWTEWIYESSL